MKELVRTNGWERRISNAIRSYKENEDFPSLSDYGIDREEFDDYVVEKQYLLDRLEDHKSSLVIPGALLVLPVVVISMFTSGTVGLFVGLLIGIILSASYMLIINMIDKKKLVKIYDERIEKYIEDILEYDIRPRE